MECRDSARGPVPGKGTDREVIEVERSAFTFWGLDMSFLGTRIMAAGLVDDGIAVEAMETQLAELRAVIAAGKPVCPICKTEMKAVNYKGYYEAFSFWECKCQSFTEAESQHGAFA